MDSFRTIIRTMYRTSFRTTPGLAGLLFFRQLGIPPSLDSAGHREHVFVAHLLQHVAGQRGPEAAAAINHYLRPLVRHRRLNVALDDALAKKIGRAHV